MKVMRADDFQGDLVEIIVPRDSACLEMGSMGSKQLSAACVDWLIDHKFRIYYKSCVYNDSGNIIGYRLAFEDEYAAALFKVSWV